MLQTERPTWGLLWLYLFRCKARCSVVASSLMLFRSSLLCRSFSKAFWGDLKPSLVGGTPLDGGGWRSCAWLCLHLGCLMFHRVWCVLRLLIWPSHPCLWGSMGGPLSSFCWRLDRFSESVIISLDSVSYLSPPFLVPAYSSLNYTLNNALNNNAHKTSSVPQIWLGQKTKT